MIDRLILYLLVAACVLLALVVVTEIKPAAGPEVATTAVSVPADIPVSPERQQTSGRYDQLVATTLARPLFSATRRPPPRGDNPAADTGLDDARLTGIVTEPGHRFAIFAPAGARVLTVTEGETVSGWRIESITPRDVSLTGPGGTKTLQPKIDPNLVPPPPPPSPANAGAGSVNRPAAAVPTFPSPPRPGMPPSFFNRGPLRPGQPRARR
jgi:general secretion pathway protein N